MYTKVSDELYRKIEYDIQCVHTEYDTMVYYMTFKDNEKFLLQECKEWRETVNLYFLSSIKNGSLKNFLDFEYVRPKEVLNNSVIFEYKYRWNGPCWKDWFIIPEDRESYASIIAT